MQTRLVLKNKPCLIVEQINHNNVLDTELIVIIEIQKAAIKCARADMKKVFAIVSRRNDEIASLRGCAQLDRRVVELSGSSAHVSRKRQRSFAFSELFPPGCNGCLCHRILAVLPMNIRKRIFVMYASFVVVVKRFPKTQTLLGSHPTILNTFRKLDKTLYAFNKQAIINE